MDNTRDPLDEQGWRRLEATVRAVAAQRMPEWAEHLDHDPGVTIAQLFAFLGEQLLWRAATIPERGREAIRESITRLGSMPEPDAAGPLTVRVDGARWREVSSLDLAGPDDTVFVVNRSGDVTFGDGQHGRRPPQEARVTASYREGGGQRGNVCVSVHTPWPPPVQRYAVALSRSPGLRVMPTGVRTEQFAGEKRLRYFEGGLLSAADLRDEQEYHLRKRRLHNRALHGTGIVAGLEVHVQAETALPAVTVEPGLALDPAGREVLLAAPLTVEIGDGPSCRFVAVEYAERDTDPVSGPDPDAVIPSRIEEGAAVRLVDDAEASDGVIVGRLVFDSAGWAVDPAFEPHRAG